MRRHSYATFHSSLKGFDLLIRQGRWLGPRANDVNYAGNPQHTQPVLERQVHEDVAGKQRQFDFFATILPTMHGTINREKATNLTLFYLCHHVPFMSCPGVNRVPLFLYVLFRESHLRRLQTCTN
jgi:hypothetical protein